MYQKLSAMIEQLPTELLEAIFFRCLNPSLLRTSRQLRKKLISPHVRARFRILNKKTEYIVYPEDGSTISAYAQVEKCLKKITMRSRIYSYTSYTSPTPRLVHWIVDLNSVQRGDVLKVKGIRRIEENVTGWKIRLREERDQAQKQDNLLGQTGLSKLQ